MADGIDKSIEERLKNLGIIDDDQFNHELTDEERLKHLEDGLQRAVEVILKLSDRIVVLEADLKKRTDRSSVVGSDQHAVNSPGGVSGQSSLPRPQSPPGDFVDMLLDRVSGQPSQPTPPSQPSPQSPQRGF